MPVFLTGAPGSGKTYVLNRFVEISRQAGKNVAMTASTGIASTHINGQTVHSWSGIGIDTVLSTLKELSRRWYPYVYSNRPVKHGGHRALADIIESIDELRYYREMMFVPDPGPTFDQAAQGCAHVEGTSLLREYEQEGDPLTDQSSAEKKDY